MEVESVLLVAQEAFEQAPREFFYPVLHALDFLPGDSLRVRAEHRIGGGPFNGERDAGSAVGANGLNVTLDA